MPTGYNPCPTRLGFGIDLNAALGSQYAYACRRHPVRGNGLSPPAISSLNDSTSLPARHDADNGHITGGKVMATVSRRLPERPHLDVPKREARELLKQWRNGEREAFERIHRRHPRFAKGDDSVLAAGPFRLSDAQLVIAREYSFAHWAELKQRIAADASVKALEAAIRADDRDAAVRLIEMRPELLHLPVRGGDWGPPMSHAANLGRLEIVRAMAALGARDFQHAFDRAVLQGRVECARWLYEHGARVAPGIVMGACETLDPAGMRLLVELNAPFTDGRGNRLAPLALALETYGRNPRGKHEILELFTRCGYDLPDTPMMAFHRGDV